MPARSRAAPRAARRVGRPGTTPRMLDHVRAGGAAPAHGLEIGEPLGERHRERGGERVARAGRVDGRGGKRRHARVAELRALLAEREHERAVRRRAPAAASVSFGVR